MASATDILNAIADGKFSTLQYYKPCRNTSGDIVYVTGSFGIVVQMQDQQANKFALKCFYEITIQKEKHLKAVSEYVLHNPSPYLVNFQYLHNELFVKPRFGTGQYLCIAIMPWIEGNTLGALINKYCLQNDTIKIATLTANFDDMAEWLLQQPIAHGDLKHNNILVTDNNQLILVDYDGMYLPEFAGEIAPELGTPEYQHPLRNNKFYNNSIDDFSILLISLSLHILHQQPNIYQQYNNGENIIFTINDFTNTTQSQLHKTILELTTNTIRLRHSLFSMLLADEPGNENGLLLPIISNSKLKLEKLSLYQEYGEFFIENIDNESKLKMLAKYYPFRYDEMFFLVNLLDWKILSENQNIKWSIKLIEKYSDKWNWINLSSNESLPWSIELLDKFEKKFYLGSLEANTNLFLSLELIERYLDYWDWQDWESFSGDERLSWSNEIIERYKDYWCWEILSRNESLSWSKELIERLENKLDFTRLGAIENLSWTIELIEQYEKKWDWYYLSINKSIPWSIKLIESFADKWYWHCLSENDSLDLSIELIERFEDKWDWEKLSCNESSNWSNELIERFEDKWNWIKLNANKGFIMSDYIIDKYFDKVNWYYISENPFLPIDHLRKYKDKLIWSNLSLQPSLPWSLALIAEFKNSWNWNNLSSNESLPWSIELIIKYENKWNWNKLSLNESLPWSMELITKYEEKWNWEVINRNRSFPWSIELVRKYEPVFTRGYFFDEIKKINWSVELIKKYQDKFEVKEILVYIEYFKPLLEDELFLKALYKDCLREKENKSSLAMLMQAMLKTDDTK